MLKHAVEHQAIRQLYPGMRTKYISALAMNEPDTGFAEAFNMGGIMVSSKESIPADTQESD